MTGPGPDPAEAVGCCRASSPEDCRRPPCPCNPQVQHHQSVMPHLEQTADVHDWMRSSPLAYHAELGDDIKRGADNAPALRGTVPPIEETP